MEIIDEKHCSGKLISIKESMDWFGYSSEEILEEAYNCKLELYVALKPFRAKLIAINKPVSLHPDPTIKRAEHISGGGDDVPLLPKYARMILRFGEAEIKSFPADLHDEEGTIYQWVLESPQMVDITRIYVFSEHVARKSVLAEKKIKYVPKIDLQKEEILKCLINLGYDPLKVPPYEVGFHDIAKADVAIKLVPSTLIGSENVLGNVWRALIKEGKIDYFPPLKHNPLKKSRG